MTTCFLQDETKKINGSEIYLICETKFMSFAVFFSQMLFILLGQTTGTKRVVSLIYYVRRLGRYSLSQDGKFKTVFCLLKFILLQRILKVIRNEDSFCPRNTPKFSHLYFSTYLAKLGKHLNHYNSACILIYTRGPFYFNQ